MDTTSPNHALDGRELTLGSGRTPDVLSDPRSHENNIVPVDKPISRDLNTIVGPSDRVSDPCFHARAQYASTNIGYEKNVNMIEHQAGFPSGYYQAQNNATAQHRQPVESEWINPPAA